MSSRAKANETGTQITWLSLCMFLEQRQLGDVALSPGGGGGRGGVRGVEHRGEAHHEGVVRLQGSRLGVDQGQDPTAATRFVADDDVLHVVVEGEDHLVGQHHGGDVVPVHEPELYKYFGNLECQARSLQHLRRNSDFIGSA